MCGVVPNPVTFLALSSRRAAKEEKKKKKKGSHVQYGAESRDLPGALFAKGSKGAKITCSQSRPSMTLLRIPAGWI